MILLIQSYILCKNKRAGTKDALLFFNLRYNVVILTSIFSLQQTEAEDILGPRGRPEPDDEEAGGVQEHPREPAEAEVVGVSGGLQHHHQQAEGELPDDHTG